MSTKKFEYTSLFRGYVLNVRQTTFIEKLPKLKNDTFIKILTPTVSDN